MKTTLKTAALVAGSISLLAGSAFAATSPTVGYNTVTCPIGSDTIVSAPFSDTTAFSGITVGAVTDNADGTHDVTLNGTPTLGAFTYYLKFNNGTHDGEIFEITAQAGAVVTVADLGDDLTDVTAGSAAEIGKFWTLETLFPDGNTTIVASTGLFPTQRATTVLLPSVILGQINVAPSQTFFYHGPDSSWRSTAGFVNADATLIWPDTYFIIRHDAASGPTSYVPAGLVDENNFTVPLSTSATGETDNFVAIPRPIPIRIDDLGLGDSTGPGAAFVASTGLFPTQRGDTLLVFDNVAALQNKAPSDTYFFHGPDNTWRSTAGFVNADAVLLNPSEGFIIRKVIDAGGATAFWVNSKNW